MKGKVIQISQFSFSLLFVPFVPLKILSAVIEKMQTVPKKS
jgi:hypothetical protein